MDSATTSPNSIAKPQQSLSEAWLQTLSSLGRQIEMLLNQCFGEDEETVMNSLRGL